jgi:hypothetical protein
MSQETYPNDPMLRDASTGVLTQLAINPNLPDLTASTDKFLINQAPGAVIATLSDPFRDLGLGTTTYALKGWIPPQLALSGANIVVGTTAAGLSQNYSVAIVATSGTGGRTFGKNLTFRAVAA